MEGDQPPNVVTLTLSLTGSFFRPLVGLSLCGLAKLVTVESSIPRPINPRYYQPRGSHRRNPRRSLDPTGHPPLLMGSSS